MEIGNKWDGKKNNINAKSGCYIFIRDEFYICKIESSKHEFEFGLDNSNWK